MDISNCRNTSNKLMRLALPMILILIVLGLGMFASDSSDAEIQTGTCNNSISWELNTETKTLTFTGTGPLKKASINGIYEVEHVIVGEGITALEYGVFFDYHSMLDISLPNTLNLIGDYAFSYCNNIKSITIPANTQKIGYSAFGFDENGMISTSSSLKTVVISPNSKLTEIGSRAFWNCNLLTSIELPESVKIIGDEAFLNCNLKNFKIPTKIENIGNGCFANNLEIKLTFVDDNVNCPMIDGVIYNKDFTSIILSIGTETPAITIPSTVQRISAYAFQNNNALEHITIGPENSLTSIDDSAFKGCTSLKDIKITNNKIQNIGSHSFEGCLILNDTLIHSGLKTLGESAYKGCRTISSVTIPANLTELSANVFEKCNKLSSVTFESDTTLLKIGDYAFNSCQSLKGLVLPSSVQTIGNCTFRYCKSLDQLVLPSSVQTIGDYSFECAGLKNIDIPIDGDLISIGHHAFSYSELKTFTSNSYLESIGSSAFENCKNLIEVNLQNSKKIMILKQYTFYNSSLKTITLPDSLTKIETRGFDGTNIEKITIPKNVTYIECNVFSHVPLKEITIENYEIDIDCTAFSSVYGPQKITYVICAPGFIIDSGDNYPYFHYSYEVHNVRFLDANGNVLNSQSVHFTDPIVPPTDTPLKDSDQTYDYVFNGWYNGYQQFTPDTHAYKDTDFTPGFDKSYIDYLITWKNHDGSVFFKETQHYGDTIYKPYSYPGREPDTQYHYSFSNWNGFTDGMTVTGNMEFTPEFTTTLRNYDVTFYDSDGYTIETTTLDYGSKIVLTSQEPYKYPDVQYNYQFAGWEGYTDGMTVTGPHAFYPLYTHTIRNYTVSFYNEGILFHSYSMDYGTEVTLPAEVPLKDSVLEYDYIFSQWYGYYDGITVSGDMSFSAEFQKSLRCYTIKFVSEGTTVSELIQEYGSYITVPENPVKDEDRIYSYLFSHWQGLNHTTVIGDETFTAAFKPVYREYTVKFISEGTLFSSKAYHYNDIIPAPAESPVKPSTAEFDYTFTGWVGFSDGFKITSDCSFTANFQSTVRSYDITFMNCGQAFWTGHLEYGTAIEIPAGTPMKGSDERFIYTFSGWEGFVPGMTVSGPHIFDSMFDRTDVLYRISFINNGTIFETRIVAYGTILTLPAKNPTREPNSQYDFEFSHWDGFVEGMTVKENSIFNAAYIENIRSYAVKFISEGKVIQENVLEYGTIIPTPPEPSKQSDDKFDYIFSHWKGLGHSTVIGEETFTAVFDKIYREYTIKFVSDNVNISTIYGHFGDLIYAPADPVRKNTAEFEYRFAGWIDYTDGMHIDGNHTFIAQFIQKIRTCNVSFVSDGLEVYSGDLPYNTEITAPSAPSKASDAEFNYSFKNWNGFTDGMKATEDHVFEAIFDKEIRSYTVKFVSEGEVISKKIMNYGTEIVAPENNPVKPDDDVYRHVFTSWKGYYTGIKVTEDCTFDAIFGNIYREYVVSFISEEQIIEQRMQRYGSEIVVPTEPTKLSTIQFDYTFSGWKGYRENMTVSGNCNFTAEFEEQLRNYHVVFSYEQEVLADSVLPYGTVITLPDNPVIKEEDSAEYMFIGWDGYYDGMTVNGDVTFDALTQKIDITYTVQFRTDDVLVDSRIYHYGDEIVIPNSPEKASTEQYDYIFVGWSGLKNEMTVTEDVTFTAEFIEQLREYTVTFISEGSKYAEYKSPFGSTVKLPKTPVKPSSDVYEYTFTGWNGYYDGMTVNRNCSFTASFEMILESMPYTEPGNNIIIQMAPGCEMNIELEMLNQITESMKQLESEFEIKIENGTISFDKDAFDSIIWDGITLTIECDVSNLSEDDVKAAEGRPVYNIDITGENGNINQFKNGDRQGSIDITVEYNLEDDESSDNLCVWYLEDGELKEKQECIYSEKDGQGYVTFNTTHLSNYVVGHEVNNTDHADSTTMMYISIGVAAVGIICLIASIIIRRR